MILEAFKLDGKRALVTGASAGLGQAIAVALAQAGADVACHGNSRQPSATCRRVEAHNRRAFAVTGDLAQRDTARLIFEQTLNEFGSLDILVNNAGTIRRAPRLITRKTIGRMLWKSICRVYFVSRNSPDAT